jgi:hypothetical protein
MATIDLTNFDSATDGLVQSSQSRAGTPDGNIFFDVATGRIELITAEELALVDMSPRGGSATQANGLSENDGVKLEALYAFEREQRRLDETLRQYNPYFAGTFKFAGSYNMIEGRKFDDADGSATSDTVDDRFKVRGSGWRELDAAGLIGRIYFGDRSLGNVEALSQPYSQLVEFGAVTDFDKDGPVDEAVQVYGDNAVDANTTTFDTRTYHALSVRTYEFNADRKTLTDSGVSEMDGYSVGFALEETPHLSTTEAAMPIAEVYNAAPGSQVGVWLNMTLEELDVAQTESGFNEADGDFTWVLNNPNAASLIECVAYLDAIAIQDADINAHGSNSTIGKQVGTWYDYSADGKIQPRVDDGSTGEGLFVEGLVGVDKQQVIFTDDAGGTKTYPFFVSNIVTVGANAVADALAWFHAFFRDGADNAPGGGDDFGDAGAITVQDSGATPVKDNVNTSGFRSGNDIVFEFDFDGDTVGGGAGENKWVVFECEGDGGVTAAKTIFQITNAAAVITASCIPGVETNV